MTTSQQRIFTEDEEQQRDAYITAHVQNDCEGCESDGDMWRPAQDCPVHGEFPEQWWSDLNERLDRRWPGTWI